MTNSPKTSSNGSSPWTPEISPQPSWIADSPKQQQCQSQPTSALLEHTRCRTYAGARLYRSPGVSSADHPQRHRHVQYDGCHLWGLAVQAGALLRRPLGRSSMPYTAEISRTNPTCFVFLVDQSTSMSDPIGGDSPQKKADVVADAINRLLTELSVKCAKEEGVRDYFHVAVVGYGATVGSAFSGALAGRDLVPLSEVADNPARVDDRTKKVPDGAGGLVETTVAFPLWMDPVANGGTPMNRALKYAETLVAGWTERYPGGSRPSSSI